MCLEASMVIYREFSTAYLNQEKTDANVIYSKLLQNIIDSNFED